MCLFYRARRRKRLAKAVDRQAKKLKAKGVEVDLDAIRAEYINQHQGQTINSSDSEDNDDDDTIDVVGGADDSDDEPESCLILRRTSVECREITDFIENRNIQKTCHRPNPFSIESLLFRKM